MTSLWFESALLPDGWSRDVRVSVNGDGRIERIEIAATPAPSDERYGSVVPGLANLHSHTFQRAMAGLAERRSNHQSDNFWTWREVMYQFLDRLTPEDIEAIAAMAFVEMLESGFTHVAEFHYLHHDPHGKPYAAIAETACRIVAAASSTGIGLTLLPVFYAHSDFGGKAPVHGQRRFICGLDLFAKMMEESRRLAKELPHTIVGVAPHSLRAVTPEELNFIVELAGEQPIHIHAAEQTREVDACIAALGARPVEWLLTNAAVDHRWCLIHSTHTTPLELREMSARKAVAGLCPITEANLGDGVFGTQDYLESDGRLGVGTDSNVLIDAAGELRALEYAQRLTKRSRNVLANQARTSTGRTLYDAALFGGNVACGLDEEVGIVKGALLNLVEFDSSHENLVGRTDDQILDSWIFAARSCPIRTVWRAGKVVVRDGRHIERERIVASYRETIRRLA